MNRTTMPQLAQRTLGVDPGVAFGLGGAIVFFLISGLVAYLNLQSLRDGNEKVIQTHTAIVSLDELLSQVQDAETGQRGFLLTNNETYLAPYKAALRAIPDKLTKIAQRTSNNPGQSQRLVALRSHVESKLSELGETIELRRTQGLEPALAIVNSDQEKVDMDAIRTQVVAMAQAESEERAPAGRHGGSATAGVPEQHSVRRARNWTYRYHRVPRQARHARAPARRLAAIGRSRAGIRYDRRPIARTTRKQHP